MRKALGFWALLLLAGIALNGCQKIEARMELKRGNSLYKDEQYRDALQAFLKGLELDPEATFAWRSVGLCNLALFRPGKKTQENIDYANRAIEAFTLYLKDFPEAPKILEYIVNLYFAAERLDEGIEFLKQFSNDHPLDHTVHLQLVSLMTKAGRIVDALEWANTHEGSNQDPQVYYLIGVNAWDKSYNDPNLLPEQRPIIVDTGLASMDRALQLKRDFQTLVYYNLLLREKAKLFLPDPALEGKKNLKPEQQAAEDEKKLKHTALIDEANKYAAEAAALKKAEKEAAAAQEKAQGIGDGHVSPDAPIPGTEPTEVPVAPVAEGTPGPEGTPAAEGTPGATGTSAETPAAQQTSEGAGSSDQPQPAETQKPPQ